LRRTKNVFPVYGGDKLVGGTKLEKAQKPQINIQI